MGNVSGQTMRAETIDLNDAVAALLVEAELPTSDLSTSRSLNLLGLREGGRLVGIIGIEVHGKVALLRSLAVAPARRNCGLGAGLVSNAETWAADRGINSLTSAICQVSERTPVAIPAALRSDFRVFCHLKRVIHLYPKVTHGGLKLGMAKQQLNCA